MVQTRDLKDAVRFSDQGPTRETLLETDKLWSQLLCLDRAQQVGPIADPGSDAVFTVVAGRVVFQVGQRRKRLEQWETALAPAGEQVTVTNASGDPAVLLIVAAPPPPPRQVTG